MDTVTQVSIKFRGKKKANKNMGISIGHDTNNTYENGDKYEQICHEPARTHCAATAQRPNCGGANAAYSRRHSTVHRSIVRNAAIGLCASKADNSHTRYSKAQR